MKGKLDHYFIIGIDESDRTARCILCKGSHYPPTTPRPIVSEIPLTIPLCEPESEKTANEAKVWQLGSNPLDEKEAVLALIAVSLNYSFFLIIIYILKKKYYSNGRQISV